MLEAIIVVAVVVAFNLPPLLLGRDLPGLLATAAVWGLYATKCGGRPRSLAVW